MQKKYMIMLGILSTALFLTVSFMIFQTESKRQPLPMLHQVKEFSLTDTGGKPFGLRQLAGKVWVAAFVFSTCGDVCPMMSKNLASLHRSYVLRDDVAFLSITVNPEYDDPKVLATYAKKYDADTDHWHFLTGPREKIRELMLESFKMGSMEEPIFHSSHFALVDRKGIIRGYYNGLEQDAVNKLFKDIAGLVKEWPR